MDRDKIDDNIAVRLLRTGRAESPAILHRGDSMTYGRLRSAVDALAAALLATGGSPGRKSRLVQ